MSSSIPAAARRPGTSTSPPIDHTRWMAAVIELVAIAGAVALAFLHSTT